MEGVHMRYKYSDDFQIIIILEYNYGSGTWDYFFDS